MTEADLMLPQDKANHAIYGAAFFLLGLAITHSLPLAMAVCAGVAAAKEGLDWALNECERRDGQPKTHDPSVFDFLATCCGGAFCYLLAVVYG